MKPWLALLLLLPATAMAKDLRGDYVRQWPLALPADQAGAYQVALDEAVYRTAADPALRDVQVLDAAGTPLPAALLLPPTDTAPRLQALPLFVLPPAASGGQPLEVVAERDASGAVQRIQTRSTAPSDGPPAWLLDASAIDAPLQAVRLQWPSAQVQAQVRVEASDDLRSWTTVQAAAALVQLDNGQQQLAQRRIPLEVRARYLRITALSPGLPALSAAQAELAPAHAQAPPDWLAPEGRPQDGGFAFASGGRFPVALADVAVAGNDAIQWVVQSRDAEDAPWTTRAGPWLAFRVGPGGAHSEPQAFPPTRDRYWRLLPASGAAPATPPQLRLGWRPEHLLFVAGGQGPYALAAGSVRALRADAPLQPMLDSLARAHGPDWQPPPATLGTQATELAGAAALQPPRDWTGWLLWGVLILGALVVAGFAFSLLRNTPPATPG